MRRILFIGAHPDDETFFAAGTIARYRSEGVEVSLICATLGEAGKTGDLCSRDELAMVREKELQRAMVTLDVRDLELLPYCDKHLAEAPPEEIVGRLVAAIRRVRPTVVITFDPQGANQHPDHIAISRFANDAVAAARDGRWYPEAGAAFTVARVVWTPPRFVFRLAPEERLEVQPGYDFVVNVSAWLGPKTAAFEAHATQFPHLRKLFFDDPNGQRTFGVEVFRLGSGAPIRQIPADDLFAELL